MRVDHRVTIGPHQLQKGTVLENRYRIEQVIGQGGFGITYSCIDDRLKLRVAVKEYYPVHFVNRNTENSDEIRPNGKKEAQYFGKGKGKYLREARILAEFNNHPGVVHVHDFFEANNTAYIVMEFLQGKTLREYMEDTIFPAHIILGLMYPVMDTLEKLHERHIIHRDISPDNLILLDDGTIKLVDFGAARELDFDHPRSISVILKDGYSPAEQYRQSGKQGPWTDVYGICATIYSCLTGLVPENALEREYEDKMKWPLEFDIPMIPQQEDVLKKGMAVKAEDRISSMAELKEAFVQSGFYQKKERGAADAGSRKAGGRKKILSGCVKMVLLVGMFIFLCYLVDGLGEKNLAKLYDEETMYHISLTADENMSVKEFKYGVEQIKERIAVLAEGETYALQVTDDRIEIVIPKVCFGDQPISDILISHIVRATDLYAFRREEEPCFPPDQFAIGRNDLESVTLEEGAVPGTDAAEYDTGKEAGRYIRIVLTEDCAKKNRDLIKAWGDDLTLAEDVYRTFYYCCDTVSAGDGKTFYVTEPNLDGKALNLLYQNLTHEPLAYEFSYSVGAYDVEWENAKDAPYAGKNQCNADDFTEQTVTIVYDVGSDSLTDGEWMDIKQAFRERLDTLGQPYAIGVRQTKEKVCLVVRTVPAHMGRPVMRWLENGKNSLSVRAGLLRYPVCSASEWREPFTISFRNWEIENEGAAEGFERFTKEALSRGQNTLTLFVGELPYCSTVITEPVTDGTIRFDTLCMGEEEDRTWRAGLLDAVWTKTQMPRSVNLDDVQFDISKNGGTDPDTQFGITNTAEEKAMEEKVLRAAPNAKVSFHDWSINVSLGLDVDEELPEKGTALVKEIFQSSDFENSNYQCMNFYLIEEAEKELERARIFFQKNYWASEDTSSPYEDGKFDVTGVFAYGRLERYQEEFIRIVNTDEFYADKLKKDVTWHFGAER